MFRKLVQQRIAIDCYEDCVVDLLEVSHVNSDDADYGNGVLKLWSIFSMVHTCKSLRDININSSHWHESQQVMAQNVVRTSWGIPGVTHHCCFEELNDSFGFLEKLSVGLHGRVEATEITVRLDSSPFCLSLSNQALAFCQWLTLLLMSGQCCHQFPLDGRWLALAQWQNIKAGMEVSGYHLYMESVATGPPSSTLDCQFFSKAHPAHLPSTGPL